MNLKNKSWLFVASGILLVTPHTNAAPSPKDYEPAGLCTGAFFGAKHKGMQPSNLSPAAVQGISFIGKELAPIVDPWYPQKNKCHQDSMKISDIQNCIDRNIPDKNIATYWKMYVLSVEYTSKLDAYEGTTKTNLLCSFKEF